MIGKKKPVTPRKPVSEMNAAEKVHEAARRGTRVAIHTDDGKRFEGLVMLIEDGEARVMIDLYIPVEEITEVEFLI